MENTGAVLAFWREGDGQRLLVALNMSAETQLLGVTATRAVYASQPIGNGADSISLAPYSVYLGSPE